MSIAVPFNVRLLTPDDVNLMESLLTTFGKAFDEGRPMGRLDQARPISSACLAAITLSRWRL